MAEVFVVVMFVAATFWIVRDTSVDDFASLFEFVSVRVSLCFCHVGLLDSVNTQTLRKVRVVVCLVLGRWVGT